MGLPTEAGEAPLFSDVLHIFATRKNTYFSTIFHSSPRVEEKKFFFFNFFHALRCLCKTSNLRSWCFRTKKLNKKNIFLCVPLRPCKIDDRYSLYSHRISYFSSPTVRVYSYVHHRMIDKTRGHLHSTVHSWCYSSQSMTSLHTITRSTHSWLTPSPHPMRCV